MTPKQFAEMYRGRRCQIINAAIENVPEKYRPINYCGEKDIYTFNGIIVGYNDDYNDNRSIAILLDEGVIGHSASGSILFDEYKQYRPKNNYSTRFYWATKLEDIIVEPLSKNEIKELIDKLEL